MLLNSILDRHLKCSGKSTPVNACDYTDLFKARSRQRACRWASDPSAMHAGAGSHLHPTPCKGHQSMASIPSVTQSSSPAAPCSLTTITPVLLLVPVIFLIESLHVRDITFCLYLPLACSLLPRSSRKKSVVYTASVTLARIIRNPTTRHLKSRYVELRYVTLRHVKSRYVKSSHAMSPYA